MTASISKRPLPIIHFNAFPGTGKMTIARALVTLFRSSGVKLIHNHLLINPADAVLQREQHGYQSLRHRIRAAIFHSLVHEPATHATAYIFTDFQTSNGLGSAVGQEYVACAEGRGCDFIPVMLVCDEETNLTRLVESERAGHGKLVDVDLVKIFRETADLYGFNNHPALLKLDVSRLSAEEAARRILDHMVKVSPSLGHHLETTIDGM